MKRIALLCAFISFFFGYMEWGQSQSAFIYEGLFSILSKEGALLDNFTHPLILLPLIGIILLISLALKKEPSKRWAMLALSLPGILILFLLFVGILSHNYKVVFSTLPFLLSAGWALRLFNQKTLAQDR